MKDYHMTDEEIITVIREKPEVIQLIREAAELPPAAAWALVVYAEAIELGATQEEAAEEAAAYLDEQGEDKMAAVIRKDYCR